MPCNEGDNEEAAVAEATTITKPITLIIMKMRIGKVFSASEIN